MFILLRSAGKNCFYLKVKTLKCLNGSGEGGIRTLDRVAPITVFETAAFNHSATSPYI